MGLDVILGLFILLAGIRGYFRGFVLQAIHLGALVGGVYLADPLRDLARPYARDYFPTIQADLLDKLLWWTAAVLAYVVASGVPTALVKAMRRRPYGEMEPNRGDQGAGFAFGAAKGFVLACFVTAGISRYAPQDLKVGGWIADQVRQSRALAWSAQYRPAQQIWDSPPVQALVARVRSRGIDGSPSTYPDGPADAPDEKVAAPAPSRADEAPPVQTASRPPELKMPPPSRLDPDSPTFLHDFEQEMRRAGIPNGR